MTTSGGASLGIGQLGLGSIAGTHREGYRQYGLRVVAGHDPQREARGAFADAVPGATAYDSLDAMLSDPRVGVVDLAAPHTAGVRMALVRAVLDAGKPLLVQKPLAMTYAEAEQIADLAAGAGTPVMVNQSMCFTPAALTLHRIVCLDQVLGQPTYAQIRTEAKFDADRHPWYGKDERWWTVALSVHHLGLLHHLLGPPKSVYALIGRDTNQPGVSSDGYGHLSLRYGDGGQALLISSGTYYGTRQVLHGEEHVWIQGRDAVVDWSPDGPTVVSTRHPTKRAVTRAEWPPPVGGSWFPHAFGLAMHSLHTALHQQATPWCTVADNLYVMAVIEAAYRSAAERRAVRTEEVMGARFDPCYGPGWRHASVIWSAPEPNSDGV